MIKFNGRLTRSAYWRTILLSLFGFIVVSGTLLWLLDIQNAEVSGASTVSQTLAIIFFIFYAISLVYFIVMAIGAVIRRAHDTENSMLWIILGLFLPFGFVILGLVPSRRNT